MKRIFLFLGKGGVGKTTSSASLSFWLAEEGHDVLWVSVDPAHNLRDIVGRPIENIGHVYKGLYAVEVDVSAYVEAYLEDAIKRMKRLYKHLSITGLEEIINAMRYSPGMEEVAILYALEELLKNEGERFEYVVVDTPPTGLTMRILAIPKLNMEWLNVLRMWRLRILDRRGMIASIKKDAFPEGVPLDARDDRVLVEIRDHMDRMRFMWDILADGIFCVKILVINQDRFSVEEGVRIRQELKNLGMDLALILVNKFGLVPVGIDAIRGRFDGLRVVELPFLKGKFSLDMQDYLHIASFWVKEVVSQW